MEGAWILALSWGRGRAHLNRDLSFRPGTIYGLGRQGSKPRHLGPALCGAGTDVFIRSSAPPWVERRGRSRRGLKLAGKEGQVPKFQVEPGAAAPFPGAASGRTRLQRWQRRERIAAVRGP